MSYISMCNTHSLTCTKCLKCIFRDFAHFLYGYHLLLFFFFSSRRRHTRCSRDWSSDVCSSDLLAGIRPSRKGFTLRKASSPTRRRCVRLSPIAQDSPLLPPVGVWTVSQFQCGWPSSQTSYRSLPW